MKKRGAGHGKAEDEVTATSGADYNGATTLLQKAQTLRLPRRSSSSTAPGQRFYFTRKVQTGASGPDFTSLPPTY